MRGPALDPFPRGWFSVGFSHELGRRPLRGVWCGRRLELMRVDGRPFARALDGGHPVPLVEQQDAVFGWFDHEDGVPGWLLPAPDPSGWSTYAGHRFAPLHTHPQETSENSVDTAHFTVVHGYDAVETLRAPTTNGPVLSARYAFTRQALPFGFTTQPIRAEFTVEVHGLGYSFVENHVPAYGLRTRQLVLCTPTTAGVADLRISGATKVEWSAPAPALRAAGWFARMGLMRAYVQDVTDDLDIWEHKVLLDPPRMVQGDGPITRYRRWCRQFYRERAAA